jgi:methyl-CpG-binding domain protein 4
MDTPKQSSPYGLIQEEFRTYPWKLLIACIMLNLTNIKQVRPIIFKFFDSFPTAESAAVADHHEIAKIIKALGLYNRRSRTIIKLSKAFISPWIDVKDLPGVGKYAADSYRIFIDGKIDIEPTDLKLKKYVEWARSL